MASITPKQHRNKKSNGDPATPPSAKSANSDTTASSNATMATCPTSVTESSAGATTAESFPLLTEEGGEGEEEEEEEEFQQKGLPDKIMNRKYLDKDGNLLELELFKDIEEFGLEDCDIDLNRDGIAHWRMAPSRMHQQSVGAIDHLVTISQGKEKDPLHTDQVFSVLINRKGGEKDPDLAVWGMDRLTKDPSGQLVPITEEVVGLGSWRVNPHVIFEFSWSHDLDDEIPKFRDQMNKHLGELGKINLGFLIKTKSSKGKQYPKKKNPGEFPMYGFDVYEARPGDLVEPANPTYKYRVEDEEEVDLIVPGHELTNGDSDSSEDYLDINIPIQIIREVLEGTGVRFEKLEETN